MQYALDSSRVVRQHDVVDSLIERAKEVGDNSAARSVASQAVASSSDVASTSSRSWIVAGKRPHSRHRKRKMRDIRALTVCP